MIEVLTFIIVSACIIFISRRSLFNPGTHGFYRFFAFEFILILFLLNADQWFAEPFSPLHVISWILLFMSGYLVVVGFIIFRSQGKADDTRNDNHLLNLEKTTRLVTTGLYGYIRHPLYSSLFFFAAGAFFKDISWIGLGLLCGAIAFLTMTAKTEEKENIDYFGAEYKEYMLKTKKFIPFIW